MTGFEILHRSRHAAAIGSKTVVAVRMRGDRSIGFGAWWTLIFRNGPRNELGRGKTLRDLFRNTGIDRDTFKHGEA